MNEQECPVVLCVSFARGPDGDSVSSDLVPAVKPAEPPLDTATQSYRFTWYINRRPSISGVLLRVIDGDVLIDRIVDTDEWSRIIEELKGGVVSQEQYAIGLQAADAGPKVFLDWILKNCRASDEYRAK